MPLIQRIQARPHTVRSFRSAARARFQEAQDLTAAGHRLAGVYLYGYTVEMLLKAAFFRLQGWLANQPITLNDMRQARQRAQSHFQIHQWQHENLHYLLGWSQLLTHQRVFLGLPYPPTFARGLNARVTEVWLNWRESARYHNARPYRGEVARVVAGARWLLGQFRFL